MEAQPENGGLKAKLLIMAILSLCLAFSPVAAWALSADELMDLMVDEKVITPEKAAKIKHKARTMDKAKKAQEDAKRAQELQQIKQEAKTEAKAEAKAEAIKEAKAAVKAAAPLGGWKVAWKNGLKITSPDKKNQFELGGRMYIDFASISSPNRRFADSVRVDEGTPLTGSGAEFRTARIYVGGTVYDIVFFKGEYDFAHGAGAVGFKDVFLGVKKIPGVGHIRVGHQKEPFSLEEQGSSRFITFMERGLPNVFAPSRNTGIMAYNTLFNQRVYWGAGVFDESDDIGNSFSNNQDWNITMRLAGTPMYQDKGNRVLHVGLSYSHQFRNRKDFQLRYRQRPESHITDARTVDMVNVWPTAPGAWANSPTQAINTEYINLLNPEVALVWGPFSVQGEYMCSFVQGTPYNFSRALPQGYNRTLSGDDPFFQGAYVFASVFLTGEHRNYSQSGAAFDRITPHRNFDLKGGWGAWELAGRYSYLCLNSKGIKGGIENDFTAGLNWYLTPNTRWMFNYVYADIASRRVRPGNLWATPNLNGIEYTKPIVDGCAHVVQTRFQVDF